MNLWVGVLFVLIGVGVLLLVLLEWVRHDKVRRSVFENLDSAYANGYFEPGEQLHGVPAFGIAEDMTVFSSDFEGQDPDQLTPYVRGWLEHKGLNP